MARIIETQQGDAEYINDLLNQIDAQRTRGLEIIYELQVNKHVQLQRELQRLVKKKSPRVEKIKARLKFDNELFIAMDAQIELTKIKPPELAPGTWRVEGFVYDKDNKPASGLTVSLNMDKVEGGKANWSGSTNKFGFYSIVLNKETVAKLQGKNLTLHVTRKIQQDPLVGNRLLTVTPDTIEIEDLFLVRRENKDIGTER